VTHEGRIGLRRSQKQPVKKHCAPVRWSLTNEKAAANSKGIREYSFKSKNWRNTKEKGYTGKLGQPSEEILKERLINQLLQETVVCQGSV
jgi:hypothetical protein